MYFEWAQNTLPIKVSFLMDKLPEVVVPSGSRQKIKKPLITCQTDSSTNKANITNTL